MIIKSFGSEKTNSSFDLVNQQPDIDEICLYSKDPHKAKHQFLIDKRKITALKHFIYSKAFVEYSNHMDDIYNNNEEDNPNKKRIDCF